MNKDKEMKKKDYRTKEYFPIFIKKEKKSSLEELKELVIDSFQESLCEFLYNSRRNKRIANSLSFCIKQKLTFKHFCYSVGNLLSIFKFN